MSVLLLKTANGIASPKETSVLNLSVSGSAAGGRVKFSVLSASIDKEV